VHHLVAKNVCFLWTIIYVEIGCNLAQVKFGEAVDNLLSSLFSLVLL